MPFVGPTPLGDISFFRQVCPCWEEICKMHIFQLDIYEIVKKVLCVAEGYPERRVRQGQRLRARPGPPLAAPHQRRQARAVQAEEAALPGRARCQVPGGRRGLGHQGSR